MIGGETRGRRPARADLRHARAGRRGRPAHPGPHRRRRRTAEQGYLHCGPTGAGHFVKMVHNGIEYGIMAAYAEGLNILQARQRRAAQPRRATPRPRRCDDPEHYQYDIDTRRGRRGLAARQRRRLVAARPDRRGAARRSPTLEEFAGRVSDSGEGRWTVDRRDRRGRAGTGAHDRALLARFASRDEDDFADKVLSAMRKEFGGHDEKPA